MTLKPFAAYASCSFCSSGISKRQGPHHVAQTLTRTTLPFSAARSNGAPSSILARYAGMASPTFVLGPAGSGAADCAEVVVVVFAAPRAGATGLSALWQPS